MNPYFLAREAAESIGTARRQLRARLATEIDERRRGLPQSILDESAV